MTRFLIGIVFLTLIYASPLKTVAQTPKKSSKSSSQKAGTSHPQGQHKSSTKTAPASQKSSSPAAQPSQSTSTSSNPSSGGQSSLGTGGPQDWYWTGAYPGMVHFKEGSIFGQAGIGLLAFHTVSGSGFSLPLFVAGEYGVTDRIGVGGIFGYAANRYNFGGGYVRYSYTTIAARGTYHFYQDNNWDTYGGLILGYQFAKASVHWDNGYNYYGNTYAASNSGIVGLFVGARYFVAPNVAILGEFGYQLALINLGVSFQVK